MKVQRYLEKATQCVWFFLPDVGTSMGEFSLANPAHSGLQVVSCSRQQLRDEFTLLDTVDIPGKVWRRFMGDVVHSFVDAMQLQAVPGRTHALGRGRPDISALKPPTLPN